MVSQRDRWTIRRAEHRTPSNDMIRVAAVLHLLLAELPELLSSSGWRYQGRWRRMMRK